MLGEELDQVERGLSISSEDGYLKPIFFYNCYSSASNLKVEYENINGVCDLHDYC